MKIAHLHLIDSLKNKKTLSVRLVGGFLDYSLYGGWSSSGTPFALSNLGSITLPVSPELWSWSWPDGAKVSKELFVEMLIEMINDETTYNVVRNVKPVEFATPGRNPGR